MEQTNKKENKDKNEIRNKENWKLLNGKEK